MKDIAVICGILFGFVCGVVVGTLRQPKTEEEAPAIVWRSSNGTTLAVGTPSKGRSYFFDNLESVTFSAPEFKSNGVVITTKP